MANAKWKKVENESGYPCYVDELTGKQNYDHPQFLKLMEALNEYNGMKYSAYRVAFKVYRIQQFLKVPPLRILSGVLARHKLSLSESSLSLDPDELEAVLADVYFAAEKEGLFDGDVDLTVDLLINLLLNVFDRDRKEPIKVLSAKTLLIILSSETPSSAWSALATCAADHNGCVSPKRLASLLSHVAEVAAYLGEDTGCVQDDVDACFSKSAGMLGVSARAVSDWAVSNSSSARWISVLCRIRVSRTQVNGSQLNGNITCEACSKGLVQVLKFKCSKCSELYFCEYCYLYDNDLGSIVGHKKNHAVLEIVDEELNKSEYSSFMKNVRQFFFCTKKKKKMKNKIAKEKEQNVHKKPAMVTSTVGKASGKRNASSPSTMLQDIISQLETQNMALKDLSEQLKNASKEDDSLKSKVDCHWTQISTQINRLKLLKDNLSQSSQALETETPKDAERIQAFDLFSPIPILEEKSKITDDLKTQPRVLSLDSGNFSVVSKETQNLMTMSGDALKPIVVHAITDSISTVSMGDISNWYNEPDNQTKPPDYSQSLCVTEKRFDEEIRTVANSNDKMKQLNAGLDAALDRLQQILAQNRAMDDSCFDNSQLRETASEMEGLLGTLIRGVEERATLNATRGMV